MSAEGVPNYGSVPRPFPAGVTATGIAVDPATGGYWVVSSAGGVFNFHAPWLGRVRYPSGGWGQYPAVVGIAAAPGGRGYYVLRANGAVVAFGAPFHGDLAARLRYGSTAPVVATGIAVDPVTGGYWILTSVGGVYNFHAPWYGSPKGRGRWDGVGSSAVSAAPDGNGYLVAQADGGVMNFGIPWHGSLRGALPVGASPSGVAIDPATGGYWEALDDTSVGGYLNPLRDVVSLLPQEVDQGVDYCGFGPVYALGPGVVLNTTSAGWPGGAFISYRLTAGPALGLIPYVAENVTPLARVGERVGPSTILGYLHDAGTCMETGWADPSDPLERAAGHAEFNGRNSTAYGLNFSALLQAVGTRPGLTQPDGTPGSLPPGWPTW
ncbi:MAG TPA: hypothetical protein VFN60_03815 [Acidimicrobiales bacterium]|nr:hypothetical protein [Acidimicrobiales bacterium]